MSVLNGQRVDVLAGLVERARNRLDRVDLAPVDAAGRAELVAETARQIIEDFQGERMEAKLDTMDEVEERDLATALIARLNGSAGLAALLADESIEDIWCQGADEVWVKRSDGRIQRTAPIAADDAELIEMIRALAAGAGLSEQERRFDRGSPILDLRLPDGARLHAVMEVSPRPSVAIRRHRLLRADFDVLIERGMFTARIGALLAAMVRSGANIVIDGATGAGKTTLLRGMISLLEPDERLITIEDTWELDVHTDPRHPNTVALQSRQPNVERAGEITLSALFRSALRMNPSRVIVGEVRGDEIVPMLHSMNQGNDGSLSTIHASSSSGVFSKMALFGAAAPERLGPAAMAQLIADGVDFVVHLDRAPSGTRVVSSIRAVVGCDGAMVTSDEIARPGPDHAAEPYVRPSNAWSDRLAAHGWRPETWGEWS